MCSMRYEIGHHSIEWQLHQLWEENWGRLFLFLCENWEKKNCVIHLDRPFSKIGIFNIFFSALLTSQHVRRFLNETMFHCNKVAWFLFNWFKKECRWKNNAKNWCNFVECFDLKLPASWKLTSDTNQHKISINLLHATT